jgi:hypothetical protein
VVDPTAEAVATARECERRFARWDGASFEAWVRGPVAEVWAADEARGADLLRLVAEGIGRGALGPLDQRPRSWLDGLLRGPLPGWIAATPPEGRAALLVRVWNLGEGAAREAPWMDRFLLARLSALSGPETVLADVTRELEPLLDEGPPCPWTGPYRVSTVDLRPSDPKFLPGQLQLLGPRVLAVADRRRDVTLGLVLGPGEPAVLGAMDPIEAPSERPARPSVRWDGGVLVIGADRVTLPALGEPLELLVAPAGYVVATAESSQRLWVVAHA